MRFFQRLLPKRAASNRFLNDGDNLNFGTLETDSFPELDTETVSIQEYTPRIIDGVSIPRRDSRSQLIRNRLIGLGVLIAIAALLVVAFVIGRGSAGEPTVSPTVVVSVTVQASPVATLEPFLPTETAFPTPTGDPNLIPLTSDCPVGGGFLGTINTPSALMQTPAADSPQLRTFLPFQRVNITARYRNYFRVSIPNYSGWLFFMNVTLDNYACLDLIPLQTPSP